MDKIHKELKKTRKSQKKVLAENAEVKQEQSKVSETLTQLLNVVQQIAEDNKVLKAKQELAEKKLGEISLKQQETAPQEIHDLSDSEFDQSDPEAVEMLQLNQLKLKNAKLFLLRKKLKLKGGKLAQKSANPERLRKKLRNSRKGAS